MVSSRVTPRVQHLTLYLPVDAQPGLVALSKMVSVSKPLRYEQLLSRNRCYRIIVSTWIFGAAVAASKLILSPTWIRNVCWFTFEAHNITVSALDLVFYLISLVCPKLVLTYANVRISSLSSEQTVKSRRRCSRSAKASTNQEW